MTLPEEAPCCLCDVEAGDARPMLVKQAKFCIKSICQSSSHPCDNNTITVTISPTTEIVKGDTVTLTGFGGAVAPSGAMQLSSDTNDHLHFVGSSSDQTQGLGEWAVAGANQVLKLLVDKPLECSGQYVFSFTVKNPQKGQSCKQISISSGSILSAPMDVQPECGILCVDTRLHDQAHRADICRPVLPEYNLYQVGVHCSSF